MTDICHRMHLTTTDPTFPAKHEADRAAIVAEVGTVAELPCVTRTRETKTGRTAINLQCGRLGFAPLDMLDLAGGLSS